MNRQCKRFENKRGTLSMSLLMKAPTIQLIPALAEKIGLNGAIVLQQLHFRSCISKNLRDGHVWVYKTYNDWQKQEFPFWSIPTIQRIIHKLEKEGYLISTDIYNRMHMDKTKWYRINYALFNDLMHQNDPLTSSNECPAAPQNEEASHINLTKAITKEELTNTTKKTNKTIEMPLDNLSVINYLNEQAHKQHKATAKTTTQLIKARYREGYTLGDFKAVIDTKVNDWLHEPQWQKYLRPSTLFSEKNFEKYLEKAKSNQTSPIREIKPFEIDMTRGEVL